MSDYMTDDELWRELAKIDASHMDTKEYIRNMPDEERQRLQNSLLRSIPTSGPPDEDPDGEIVFNIKKEDD